MAESYIQVPTDGSGKKLHTVQKTVSGNTVEEQVIILSDGNDAAEGATGDTAYSDSTGAASGSVIALLKGLYKLLAATLTFKRALGATTASSVSVTTSSAQIVAANTSRKSLRIVNPASATKNVYLEFGTTSATTSSATVLTPGDTYYETEASDRVNAIVSTGTQSVNIFEVA